MSISHIYREGNQSADTLATHGHFHQEHFEFLSFLMALFLLPLLPKELVEQSWRTNTNSKQSLGSLSLGGCSTRLTKLSIDTNNKRTSFPSTTEKRSLPPPTYSTHSILFDPIPRRWILFHYPCLEGDSVALNYYNKREAFRSSPAWKLSFSRRSATCRPLGRLPSTDLRRETTAPEGLVARGIPSNEISKLYNRSGLSNKSPPSGSYILVTSFKGTTKRRSQSIGECYLRVSHPPGYLSL
ncbi:unnamed protein product [Lactuca saligna]|uniref:Uncharacterized protein n=1 Tax=Lactuca saligna TaxID=75948 RepID=A0AA35XZM9_LACSI|nr:unnamed protein product [Lactuca saligna]CAI9260246.1 unnamed protein product [Lactuca saligna]CAI9261205.1 unnamed protein product [Lactuca saligna]CAI9263029.1 unnamed protein product [Lactuca saligna]CAI9264056.1 unnamed protein product [Lactuca saligna]